jgi:(E)-4-hydroxy-3-methylbut-2-enyl-diphosphate synthase
MGGDAPISIQTMWDSPLHEVSDSILVRLQKFRAMGCDLVRFAVPDEKSVEPLGRLAAVSPLPLVADIHFDYRLAMAIMDYPIVKLRINPGNIGADWKVAEICLKAKDRGIAIRVGGNAGSLQPKHREMGVARGMAASVEEQIGILRKHGFENIVVSLKASDTEATLEANRLFRKNHDEPLHIGITEAGPLVPALIKSTLGLSGLLNEGIGDTVRISISDTMETEILAARELLAQLGLRKGPHVEIISCPRCGRTEFDTHAFALEVQDDLYALDKSLKVAIMGCPVNGPGEARDADIGITGSGDVVVIFKNGTIIRREKLCNAKTAFLEEIASFC